MQLMKTQCSFHYFLRTALETRHTSVLQGSLAQRWLSSKSSSSQEKKLKSLQLTSRISPHDLQVKIKKLSDLVQKGHTTKVAIKNVKPEDSKTPANLFKEFTLAVQEYGTVKQSQSTATELVFIIKPIASSNDGTTGDENEMDQNELKPAKLHKSTKVQTDKT